MDDLATTLTLYNDTASQRENYVHYSEEFTSANYPLTIFPLLAVVCDLTLLAAFVSCVFFIPLHSQVHLRNGVICAIAVGSGYIFGANQKSFHLENIAFFSKMTLISLKSLMFGLATIFVLTFISTSKLFQHSGSPLETTTYILVLVVFFLAFAMSRLLISIFFRFCVKNSLVSHQVALIGASSHVATFINAIAETRMGISVRAIYDDRPEMRGCVIEGVTVVGDIWDLLNDHKDSPIDHVVITAQGLDDTALETLKSRLSMQPIRVRQFPSQADIQSDKNYYAGFGEIPGIKLAPVMDLPLGRLSRFFKSLFDRLSAAMALLFLAPVLLVCIAGIKLSSPGPILFRQKRIGYRNKIFEVYKFRSMHLEACNLTRLTARDDPRVFGFGKFMRKLSLDELPQLFNVLRGEMSMVGPRPHMREARAGDHLYYEVCPDYAARHCVKPGITGWAQVNGWRGPTETAEAIRNRVAHDLHYIKNWSFWLDIKILIRTALGGFFGHNAF
jgi:Undecaprenyl-phosphate glucose phosphotransferase